MMRDLTALKERHLRDPVPTRLGNLASNLAHISTYAKTARHPDAIHKLIDESRFFIEWTAGQLEAEKASQLVDLQVDLCRWYWQWPAVADDPAAQTRLSTQARKWSSLVLDLSGLLDEEPETPSAPTHEVSMRQALAALRAQSRRHAVTTLADGQAIEEKGRRAIRAAKFEETPKDIWLKVLPTVPEGVSTTRASELFDWAREMIVGRERDRGLSESEANQAAALAMLTDNVY